MQEAGDTKERKLIISENIVLKRITSAGRESDYDESDDAITQSVAPKAIVISSVSFEIFLADIYNPVNFEQVDAEPAPEVGEG